MREDLDDFETNQQVIGMKYLFRGFSIKAWKRTNVDENKHTTCNRIVNQHCMNYYYKCWKDRNEKLHDKELQKKRLIEQQQKESAKTLEGQHPHVQKFAIDKKLEVKCAQQSNLEDGHMC